MPWSRVNTEYSIHWVQHTPSTAYTEYSINRSPAYTEYCIQRAVHHLKIDDLPLPASLLFLRTPFCTQFSSFAQLRVNQRIKSQLPSRFQIERLLVLLQSRSIMASNCISKPTQLRPPNYLNCDLKLARSWPRSLPSLSLNHSLQVYL